MTVSHAPAASDAVAVPSFVPESLAWLYPHAKRAIEWLKYGVFTIVVTASVIVIIAGIAADYCVLQVHPAALYIILFFTLLLLAYVEALHYSNVAVEKWDMTKFETRYPRACRVQKLVDNNEKVQRFLVGRQFFVIFVVFIIAQITTLPGLPKDYLGLPQNVVAALLGSGLPGIMLVLNIGQLVPQLFVEEFTLQFMNMFGCYFVTQLSFFAEFVGVCNFSWLLFHFVDHFAYGGEIETPKVTITMPGQKKINNIVSDNHTVGEPLLRTNLEGGASAAHHEFNRERHTPEDPVEYDEGHPNLSLRTGWFDVLKHFWSTGVTLGSLFIVCYGISQQYSVLPAPVPALYVILFAMLALLFYLEGLMICIVATQYWDPEEFRESHPRAYAMHKLVNKPDVVKRFIVGRQFFTLLTNFLLAQVTVFAEWPSEGYNPVLFFILIRSGLVGVLIVLAFAQLLPELLAARHPVSFMNFYGSITIVRLSLVIEAVGVGHCAWLIFYATRGFLCGSKAEIIRDDGDGAVSDASHEILGNDSCAQSDHITNSPKSYGSLSESP